MQEVLHSVFKTEETLRKLKNRNVTFNDVNQSNAEPLSDEAKIKEQIRLDVEYFTTKV